jgi:phage tail sheath protein FI
MVQVSYPGVYIVEVPSGVHTITGVATSIAAFLGHAKEGPVNKAIRLLSYGDYEKKFGLPQPGSELGAAVRLFFQNGGTDCYVVRLVKTGTGSKAYLTVKNEGATNDVLKFTAKEIGVWGNELAVEVDYATANPEDTFHLRVYRLADDGTVKAMEEFLNCSMDKDSSRYAPNLITQDSNLVDCTLIFATDADYKAAAPAAGYSEARRLFTKNQAGRDDLAGILASTTGGNPKDPAEITSRFKISIDGSPLFEVDLLDAFASGVNENIMKANITTKINDALPAALKNKVTVSIENGPGNFGVLRFTSSTTDKKSVVIQPGSSNDLTAALMLGTDQGGIERSRYAVLRPAPTGTFLSFAQINALANLDQSSFDSVTLDSEVKLGTDLVTKANNAKWYEDGAGGFDGVREKLAILARKINDAGIGWTARVAGSRLLLAKRSGLSNFSQAITLTTGAPPNPVPAATNCFSANTKSYVLGSGVGTYQGAKLTGVEGDPPDVKAYKGSLNEHTGFYALDLVDLFNLMILPKHDGLSEDQYRELWGPASAYCQEHRAFLLIDPPDSWSKSYTEVTDPSKGIRKLRIGTVKTHAAVFYPKIMYRDNGLLKALGPAGAIGGIMARTDAARGVWKAAAGLEAAVVGVLDVELQLTDLENGVLNKEGVNCIRSFPGGIIHWGARTLDGADDFGSEWKYIPIRRLALFLEESLYRGTKWVIFEPNDEPLWAKIRLNIGAFMMGLFRQGAFQGSTPDKAFYVKCDGETTTQADRDLGIVNIEVGFAPLKPAEFVVIKIQQIAGQL